VNNAIPAKGEKIVESLSLQGIRPGLNAQRLAGRPEIVSPIFPKKRSKNNSGMPQFICNLHIFFVLKGLFFARRQLFISAIFHKIWQSSHQIPRYNYIFTIFSIFIAICPASQSLKIYDGLS
jgi:hypothetical protein